MSFLLDTCTISAHVRRPSGLQSRFVQYSGRLYVASVALAELYVLAFRLGDPTARLAAIDEILRDEIGIVDFDADCARIFGQVRAELTRRGAGVPPR